MSDTSNSTRPESRWSRFLGFLRWLDQAMEATETDILDCRLRRLEREVAQLKGGQAGEVLAIVVDRPSVRIP